MHYVLYGLLLIYSLPLIGFIIAAFQSSLFSENAEFVRVASVITGTYLSVSRDPLGNLVLPLVTVYSVQLRSPGQRVPRATLWLLAALMLLATAGSVSYSLVTRYELDIRAFGQDVFERFRDLTLLYFRDALAYIAVVLGISAKTTDVGAKDDQEDKTQ